MEYKYHPLVKYVVFFIIVYMFIREQKVFNNDLLLANSLLITFLFVCLDIMFIHNHPSLFKSLKNQHDDEINDINDDIDQELNKNIISKSDKAKLVTKEEVNDVINNIENVDNLDKAEKIENFINSNRSNFTLGNISRTSLNNDYYLTSEQSYNNIMS